MSEHDAEAAFSHRLSTLNKRSLLQGDRLSPHQTGVASPGSQTDNDHDIHDIAAKQRNDD